MGDPRTILSKVPNTSLFFYVPEGNATIEKVFGVYVSARICRDSFLVRCRDRPPVGAHTPAHTSAPPMGGIYSTFDALSEYARILNGLEP